jgi:hypothetical protein
MFELHPTIIAVAWVEGGSYWEHLKIDALGSFRWYLDGVGETNIRGNTQRSGGDRDRAVCRSIAPGAAEDPGV